MKNIILGILLVITISLIFLRSKSFASQMNRKGRSSAPGVRRPPPPAPTPAFRPAPAPRPAPTPAFGPAPTPAFGYAPTPAFGPAPAPTPAFGPAPTPAFGPAPTPAPAPSPATAPVGLNVKNSDSPIYNYDKLPKIDHPSATVISTVQTTDPEICATSCNANQSCLGFNIDTVVGKENQPGPCKLISSPLGREYDTNYRNSYLKKLVEKGPNAEDSGTVPVGGDCWPNKMHYRSSLNATPLNTLQEKCNSSPIPPLNTIDYTQLGGTLMPGTNFVKVPDKYPATMIEQNYGSADKCSAECADNPLCAGFHHVTTPGTTARGTCVYFGKNTEFWDIPSTATLQRTTYKKAYLPDVGFKESPGMIKMTGATATGSFNINNSATMNGTAAQCKATCGSNGECGGFIRNASLADSAAGICTWKSLTDTTPSFDESTYPYPLNSENVTADATKNLWRKQPRKTPITGTDAPLLVYSADFNNFSYNQPTVDGYEIRRQKFPNGSEISKTRGTVDMCAKSCTATSGCNSFVHTAGVDDDQVADCALYSGSTNKNTAVGINAWLMDAFYKV